MGTSGVGTGLRRSRLESEHYLLLHTSSWAIYLNFLSLSFLNCDMRMGTILPSQGTPKVQASPLSALNCARDIDAQGRRRGERGLFAYGRRSAH